MDADRFDSLSRSLSTVASRRFVVGLSLGGAFTALPLAGHDAWGKRKKRKKPCPNGAKRCGCACVPNDACCPACTTGFTCLSNGSCGRACSATCPAECGGCNGNIEGQAFCLAPGGCENIGDDCTSMADCPQGYQCQLNSCPPGVATRCMPLCTR
jgi:hypothetical protein